MHLTTTYIILRTYMIFEDTEIFLYEKEEIDFRTLGKLF